MSNYAEEDTWKKPETKQVKMKPIKKYGSKIINAAGRAIEKPNKHSKYTLAAWANLDISPECIKKSIELKPGEMPSNERMLQISELYLNAREDGDAIRQLAYAAFMGVRPLISNEDNDQINRQG